MQIRNTSTFSTWLNKLKDRQAKMRIVAYIQQVQLKGQLTGTLKPVGSGVSEIKFYFGSGYRVYFAQKGNEIVILLAGGDKSTQQRDIVRAQELLHELEEAGQW